MMRARSLGVALALSCLVGCVHAGQPRDAEAALPTAEQLVQVAELAEQTGDPLRAQQYLLAALRAGADEREVVPRLLALYVNDGQYRVAIDQAEHHLRRHPRDQALRLLLSTLYTAVGEEEHAIAEFERVLEKTPNDAYAHFALASLLHDTGGAAERADVHYRAYLELDPHGPHADEARGLLLREVP